MPLYRRPVLVAGRPRPGAPWQWFKLLGHTGRAAGPSARVPRPGLAGLGTGVRSGSLAACQSGSANSDSDRLVAVSARASSCGSLCQANSARLRGRPCLRTRTCRYSTNRIQAVPTTRNCRYPIIPSPTHRYFRVSRTPSF